MAIFDVQYSLSGDCSLLNNGAVSLTISGDAPDYRIEFLDPQLPTIFLNNYDIDYTIFGLSAGTYVLSVKDSSIINSQNPQSAYTFSVNISSGTCVTITDVQHTTCGAKNGSITVSTPFSYNLPPVFELYDISGELLKSITNSNDPPEVTFFNLSPGIYYVVTDDGGGCSGRSESVLIKESTQINFDFYIINNSACYGNLGKIYITGLTGTPPFTYQWSNGETTPYITGLTAGIYSVQVTDGLGCTIFPKFGVVGNAGQLDIINVTTQNPDCQNGLGSISLTISGGSAPYNFSGSNGVSQLVFTDNYTFTNLAGGNYSFLVTDAGLCTTTTSINLLPANSFVFQGVNITNSNCNGFGGEIVVYLLGSGTFTYILTDSNGSSQTLNAGNSATFQNLKSGTYTLEIIHNVPEGCRYVGEYTITNQVPFDVFAYPSDTTCNRANGSVEIEIVGSGQSPYTIEITGRPSLNNIFSPNTTVSGLLPGNYNVRVVDDNGCINGTTFSIQPSNNVDFVVLYQNGSLYLNIIQGTPPFTIQWGSPYQNETGLVINDVLSGNYSVTVTDSLGCVLTRVQEVEGVNFITGETTVNVCNSLFSPGEFKKRTIKSLFFEGYTELIQNEVNCRINNAEFISEVIVSGEVKTEIFYTADTLNLPANLDELWVESIVRLLETFYGIGDVDVDILSNQITINTDCEIEFDILNGAQVVINLKINYDISCDYCSFIFENCCDPNDTIDVGVLYDNFDIGDTIVLNSNCYFYTGQNSTNSPIFNKDYPDYFNIPDPCGKCRILVNQSC